MCIRDSPWTGRAHTITVVFFCQLKKLSGIEWIPVRYVTLWKWYIWSQQRYAFSKLRRLQGGGGGVHKLAPYLANFCKISRLCGAVSSSLINKSLSNSATLLVLRRFSQRCRRIFANWLFQRLKNPRKVCYHMVITVNLFTTWSWLLSY